MDKKFETHIKKIQDHFADSITKIEEDRVGCPVIWVKKEEAIALLHFIKRTNGLEYEFLADLTAYDEMGCPEEKNGRFVVVYNLYSPAQSTRIRVKVRLAMDEEMPTTVGIWSGANWAEREVFDLFGVKFEGHPDLRRILLDVRWQGHPLRKDYHWRKYQLFNDPEPIPEHLLKEE